jgi:two-component system, response regulator YesN
MKTIKLRGFWGCSQRPKIGGRRNIFRVLIVEDNPHFREIFRKVFRNKFPSCTIQEAGNGEETLQIISERSPDLIFLDILLSGENGLQLAEKIKKDFPNIRIAVLTNYDLPQNRRMAAKFGVERFYIKDSLNWEEIKEWVAPILENPGKK